MAIGGNIKVTLTLDDAGFTVKSQQAASGIKNMNSEIKGFAGGLEKAETSIKRFGERVQTVSKEFTALNNYAKAASKTLNQLATSNENLDRTTAALNASFANLQATVGQFATRLAGATDSIGKASVSGDALARTNRQIGDSTKAAADGMTRQERAARNLGNAQQSVTQQIKLSALATKDAAAVALATEVTNNEKMVASKRTALASMIRAEQEYNRQLEAAKAQAMATSMKLESRRLPNGRMAGANSEYMRDLRYQLQLELDKVKALQQSVNLISQEGQRMQSTITAAQQRNAQLREGIALRERDLANVQRYQQAIRDGNMNIINAERAKRAEIAQQNAMVREQMGLVKSLGQMWASMKIYQGEKAAVNEASLYQQNELRMRGMGLNDQEIKQFDKDTRAASKQLPGVSITDAQEGYAAVAGGLATKDRQYIAPLLNNILETAKNLQFSQGPENKQSYTDLARNATGFLEIRQLQYDVEGSKKALDFLVKSNAATGGKIDMKDLETFLRRVGGGANQITDAGLARIVAMLDMAKVAGGGSGGGAGGVSTVGTMVKMIQAYSSGKMLTNGAVKEFADAGLINLNAGIDPNKQVEMQVTALKRAGLVNNKEFMQDPVKALQQVMRQAFLSMTSTPEKRKDYFGSANANINDPELQRAAYAKWTNRLGMTTTANTVMQTIADPRFQQRADHQYDLIQGSMGNKEFSEARMKTYEGAADAFTASLKNLQVTLGTTVLPLLTEFFTWLNKIVQAASDFGTNVPMAAQLTMIGGALAGAVLGLKGFAGMMGIVVKAGASFGIFGNSARAAAIATGTLWQAAGAALNPFTVLKGTMTGVGQAAGTWATTMSAANTRLANSSTRVLPLIGAQFRFLGVAITSTLGFIGKAFLRAIPFVGWLLLAWDLGGILANFEVGGAKISAWLDKWWNDLLGKGMEWWTKFKGLFDSDDAAKASTDAALKKIKEESDKRQADFDKQRKDAQARKDADDKAKKEADDKAKAGVDDLNGQTQGAAGTPPGGDLPLGNYNWDADGKEKRGFEDPFTSSLAEMRRKATIDAQKAGAAIADTGNDLAAEARTAFQEKWIAGDFDPGHDPKKRQFKGANGELDWNAQGAGGTPQQWVDQYVAMKRAEEQLKSMQFVKQRVAGAEEDFRNAMERTAGETGKQNRDLAALERELARAGERLKTGTADWAAWSAEKNRALETKAGAVLVNFTADFAEGDRKSMADLAPDGFLKQTAEMDASIQKDREQYEELARNHKKYYDDELAAYKEQLATKQISGELYTQKVTEATQRYTTSAEKAETAYTAHVQVQNQLRMRAAETAMQRQAREWQNTYSALDTATASWANGLMDNLSTALTGGRADWKSFLRGMLSDLMNIKLKEGLGGLVNGLFGGLQQMLNGTLFSNASTAGSGGGIMNGLSTIGSGVMSLFGGGTGSAASNASGTTGAGTGGAQNNPAAAANNQLAAAANTATTGLQNMSQTGIMGAITSIGQWIVSLLTGTTASSVKATADTTAATETMTVSTAMLEAALAATNLSIALNAAATTSTATAAFANGGIMSSSGSLPLMKYANGGVANKPQLALFGEGRMNEAYVPLPDGRSIPVTMKGDAMTTAGAGQTVNSVMIEINVTGDGNSGATTGKSSSGGDSNDKTWDVMASRVKGVVMEVLANEKRPNGILTK